VVDLERGAGEREIIPYKVDETVRNLCKAGFKKMLLPPYKLLFSGFMAGLYIGLGFMFAISMAAGFHPKLGFEIFRNSSLFKLMLGAVFPVGLIAVVLGGAELWTGNVQVVAYPLLSRMAELRRLIYNWIGVYGGNFIGSIFTAIFLSTLGTDLIGKNLFGDVVVSIMNGKLNLTFWNAFWRGVGCNILVNLAIWLSTRCKDYMGKMIALWFPVFAFVSIGFEHSIANMWVIPAGIIISKNYSLWFKFFFENLLPVTLGNGVGGFIFISLYYWSLCQLRNEDVNGYGFAETLKIVFEIFIGGFLTLSILCIIIPGLISYFLLPYFNDFFNNLFLAFTSIYYIILPWMLYHR